MKMVPYNKDELKYLKPGHNQKLLLEFAESGLDCVKLEGYPQKNAKTCQSNLSTAAVRLGLRHIKVVVRKENVFLLKVTE